ncbi:MULTISPECIES: methylamine utilization protein [unclassified Methylophaga]|jgi:plastocyanin|uniref:methylamine utilization protein n=1 Tax=unclassified Methylophaga TaxID=2629249 RepID=UPI000C94BD05|nr:MULTISPECIES: methylamine utilization protein [unclassified Methylophaga]MAK66043.1 methylamine utilization protein [Methylophaga sp.]MAY18579.1 methylamine utilization protein [Methylophaga sp.]MAY18957.1 methylamine utilization protein [Methylophaga sp.]MBN46345.1 methylamine utilization protein [Methylophaga sp.]HCD06642.1 methylamine utilization protein [Methylophaga sp.]|tara:strand:+ start:6945 stop:7559 length:615 start_codon:yes stop_codon:yes gene_type:complete
MTLAARADAITLKIIDQNQQAVPNAIIEVLSSSESHGEPDSVTVMDQIDKTFVPEQIIIQQGETVDFPNSDNIRHHVYSFSKAKTFELKLYADKPEKPILFESPGIVVVGCNIHDAMIGYIYVAQHETVVTSSEQGIAFINTTAPKPLISIWHPYTTNGAESRKTVEIDPLIQNTPGEYIIQLELTPPPPRESFEDTFGAAGHH